MALLLHLTDLHLSPPSMADALGDYKELVLTKEQYQTRTGHIRSTLRSLGEYLRSRGLELDALVVSGDVTIAGRSEGFELLPEVLGELKTSLPNANRVVITPGNHDVTWDTPPGSDARYQQLVGLRNATGYRTAYLDGIDIDGTGKLIGKPLSPLIEGTDGSYVLLPMNSSNNSGTTADVEEELDPHLSDLRLRGATDPAVAALIDAWNRRGLFDVARVDTGQLEAMSQLLAPFSPSDYATRPLRIAALHHPIAPVTGTEEFKPFETLTNLGQFREWLKSSAVDIVLHGHTHISRLSHDSHVAFGASAGSSAHRFVVVSGGTIGLGGPVPGPVGRLIETSERAPAIRPIRVAEIRSQTSTTVLNETHVKFERVDIRSRDQHAGGIVAGATVDDVFEQLLGLENFDGVARPLVCRVSDGVTALNLPQSYAGIRVPESERAGWLASTVKSWQSPVRGQGAAFNHGERLRRYGPDVMDQIKIAGTTLAAKPASSRAVAVLLRPESDLRGEDKPFPAFILLHATVRRNLLDIVAYFRKQEMPHWWPVNMAELAVIQEELVAVVVREHPMVAAGSITTVTSMPGAGPGVPDVLIPWVDLHAGDSAVLVEIISPLVLAAPDARARWDVAFRDWVPGAAVPLDADPVPTVGLGVLIGLLDGLRPVFPEASRSAVSDLSRALSNIHRANEHYKHGMNGDTRAQLRTTWRDDVSREIAHMDIAIGEILSRRP